MVICVLLDIYVNEVSVKFAKKYGWGHEGAPVLLPGFAI